ncbi:PadR family transcriptional regulator [Cellulomonas sp. NPDC089187]|uniref:PadR family transcriptional regulator n=1 Tax=Cellulomonas sp. NPDC089187 TaxID=3154970 RepID=UPI00343024F7
MHGSFTTDRIGAGLREMAEGARELFEQRPSPQRRPRGDVRAAILALLAEEPMHGYQLISEIEKRSGGTWRPSPGSVYPTLQLLADEGLVRVEAVGEKKTYALTEAGVQAAEAVEGLPWESASSAAAGDPRVTALPKAGMKLAQALAQFGHDATPEQIDQAVQVVNDARRKIYTILAEG